MDLFLKKVVYSNLKFIYMSVFINYKYHRTNTSEEIDIDFKGIGCKYEPYFSNGGHGLMQKAVNFNVLLLFMLKEVLTEFTFGI